MKKIGAGVDPSMERHVDGCRLLTALRCPVSCACSHGFDVCPECDPCTCDAMRRGMGAANGKK